MLTMLALLLTPSPALLPPAPAALIDRDDHDHGQGRGRGHEDRDDHGHGRGHDNHGDERRDRKAEDDYWKHQREWHKHDFHQGPRHPAPTWMNTWWRPGESRYCAVVPGDPSQVYVFVGGRWMLRHVYDPRFRADISGAFALPEAPPPPVPPPHVGVSLRIVLFN